MIIAFCFHKLYKHFQNKKILKKNKEKTNEVKFSLGVFAHLNLKSFGFFMNSILFLLGFIYLMYCLFNFPSTATNDEKGTV